MSPNIFDTSSSQKDTIIILHQYATLSINYLYTNRYDIYVISNLNIFEKHLRTQLSQDTLGKVTIITVLSNIEAFILTMVFLNSFDNDEGRLQNKNQFAEEYAYYLKEMQYGNDTGGYDLDEAELNFPPGHCDVPLPFELVVVLDNVDLKNDHLSPRSVFLQKLLRFVSLKHGGTFVCTSNTQALMTKEKIILSFLLQIGYHDTTQTQRIQQSRTTPEPIAIYESDQSGNNGNVQVRLLSPKGWDSWNKIQILATSAIHEKDNLKYHILANENEFNKLNLMYNAYIDSINSHVDQNTAEHRTAEECKNDLFSLLFPDHNNSKKTHEIQKKQSLSLEEVLEKLQSGS